MDIKEMSLSPSEYRILRYMDTYRKSDIKSFDLAMALDVSWSTTIKSLRKFKTFGLIKKVKNVFEIVDDSAIKKLIETKKPEGV